MVPPLPIFVPPVPLGAPPSARPPLPVGTPPDAGVGEAPPTASSRPASGAPPAPIETPASGAAKGLSSTITVAHAVAPMNPSKNPAHSGRRITHDRRFSKHARVHHSAQLLTFQCHIALTLASKPHCLVPRFVPAPRSPAPRTEFGALTG
jgi:hypothetical protein